MNAYNEGNTSSSISVTELNRSINLLLQNEPLLTNIWVSGEISNWAVNAASGHAYFSIKDERSSISCAMWKGNLIKVRGVGLKTGTQIKCHGSVSVYEPQGKLQLIVDSILPFGEGAYYAEFLRVKSLLEAEGLFDPDRKKQIPPMPKNIGVVTSASGAALQDIINTLSRRMPLARLWVSHTPVQGVEAPAGIVSALKKLIESGIPDVIIIARGGGSLEDLWAFNDEQVARTVAASPIPVISGVGHETDTTIVDFVADLRAPTPTAAAERASLISIDDLKADLMNTETMIINAIRTNINLKQNRNENLAQRVRLLSPSRRVINEIQRIDMLSVAFDKNFRTYMELNKSRLESLSRQLSGLNPSAVLRRGYAIVQREANEDVIKDSDMVTVGERLKVFLNKGKMNVRVESKEQ